MKAKTVTTRCWAEASPSAPAPAGAPTAKPRRLSPFGSISLREPALAGHRPHRGRCFAVPVTAAPRRGPNGKNPALFGYFLNTKKVTPSADFVIGPAKAEAFLFSHTRLPFPPRPLLPFGRISPAAKPGWPVTGPAFWVCRAKSRAAFRCAKPPCAVVRFAAMASPPRTAILPFPSRLRRAGAPTAKPRRSLVTFLTLRK